MLEAVKPLDHLTYMTPIPGQDNRVQGVRSAELEIFSMPPRSALSLPKMLQMKDRSQAKGSRQLHPFRLPRPSPVLPGP